MVLVCQVIPKDHVIKGSLASVSNEISTILYTLLLGKQSWKTGKKTFASPLLKQSRRRKKNKDYCNTFCVKRNGKKARQSL